MNKDEFEAKFKEVNAAADPMADGILVNIADSPYSWAYVLVYTLVVVALTAWAVW